MTKEARMRALKAADPETFAWIEDIWDSIFLEDEATEAQDVILDEMDNIEHPEEETNSATDWAEWELDHMIDSYREDRMLYEI